MLPNRLAPNVVAEKPRVSLLFPISVGQESTGVGGISGVLVAAPGGLELEPAEWSLTAMWSDDLPCQWVLVAAGTLG